MLLSLMYVLTTGMCMNVNVYANELYVQVSFENLKMCTHMSVYELCMCVFGTPVATFAGPFTYLPQLGMLDVK